MKRSILVTIALLSSMFVALAPASAPGNVIEKPVWHVGDSWSMGKTVDLSQYQDEIQTALLELGEGNSMEMSGGIGYYQTLKVVNDDYMIDDIKHYRLSVKAAFGANVRIDMSISMDDDYTGPMSMDGWITAVIDVWIDGYAYLTVEDLAVKKVELVIKIDMKIEGEFDMTASGMSQSMSILMEATGLEIEFDLEFTPAFDIFDFPIEDGETWWIPEVDTEMDMSMAFDGTIRMKLSSGGMTIDESLDLSESMYQIDSSSIIDKHTLELTAGKSGENYDIKVVAEGLPMEFFPIDDIGLPLDILDMSEIPMEMTFQFNPEKGFIESVSSGEGSDLALEPVSESDVDAFYADPSGGVPGPGMDLWLILLIILIVAVVVIVITAVLVRRRRKKRAEGVYGPPGAQPPQPGVQPYPPQQPQPPPQTPPPQQPYAPPPPPPPSH